MREKDREKRRREEMKDNKKKGKQKKEKNITLKSPVIRAMIKRRFDSGISFIFFFSTGDDVSFSFLFYLLIFFFFLLKYTKREKRRVETSRIGDNRSENKIGFIIES